jgi:phenylalanyl-tRNA synthetase beta chain
LLSKAGQFERLAREEQRVETTVLIPLIAIESVLKPSLLTGSWSGQLSTARIKTQTLSIDSSWWNPNRLVVGEVVDIAKHPDADRLVVVKVDHGAPTLEQVVTSAPNIQGLLGNSTTKAKIAFARVGATLVHPNSEEMPRSRRKLKSSNVRGVRSHGMVCSERELGLSDDHDSVPLLPADATLGMALDAYLGEDILRVWIDGHVGFNFSVDEWVTHLKLASD